MPQSTGRMIYADDVFPRDGGAEVQLASLVTLEISARVPIDSMYVINT